MRLVMVLAAALAAVGEATAQDVAGTWEVTWAQAVRVNGDGSVEFLRWGEAVLTLAREGERVTGTWVGPLATWKVEGSFSAGSVTLSAHEHDSSDPQMAAIERFRWSGRLDGDRLEGQMWIDLRDRDREPPARPWRAVRRRGS